MKKIKLFKDKNAEKLEREINEFITVLEQKLGYDYILDIKYSTCVDEFAVYYSVIIIYEYDTDSKLNIVK